MLILQKNANQAQPSWLSLHLTDLCLLLTVTKQSDSAGSDRCFVAVLFLVEPVWIFSSEVCVVLMNCNTATSLSRADRD